MTERELLDIVEAIKKIRFYLELQDFEFITDHSTLLAYEKKTDNTR